MGTSADQIDRRTKETRDHHDESLDALEQRTASNGARYGKIAALAVVVAAVATAGVLIYRRVNRPTRSEQLRRLLVDALQDLPESLRGLPEQVATKLKKPVPSIKVVVNAEDESREPGTLETIARRIAPAMVGTASSALVRRFSRSSEPEDARQGSSTRAYD
jgi:hypothetical protein